MKETGVEKGCHPNHEALSSSMLSLEHDSHVMIIETLVIKKLQIPEGQPIIYGF